MNQLAYVDEAMHQPAIARATCHYVLAALLLQPAYSTQLRELVKTLRVSGPRFHWRVEHEVSRRKAIQTVAAADASHIVVVGAPLDGRKQERARRQCLKRLLFELEKSGVEQVFLESRTQELNRAEITVIDQMRRQHIISPKLRLEYAKPEGPVGEPLLWIPDVICGAVTAAFKGNPAHLASVAPLIERHDIALT